MNTKPWLLMLAAVLATVASLPVRAHCGANDQCVYSPCHHGPSDPDCIASKSAGSLTANVAKPEVKETMQEIVIPKVPQLNLPVGGGARPRNAPAPLGKIEAAPASAREPIPQLPASAIARDVVPQVYAGTLAATREIDNARALEKLQRENPRLAGSSYLTEHRESKLKETFKRLQDYHAQTQEALNVLKDDPTSLDLRNTLGRANGLLQVLIDTEHPVEGR